MARFVGGQKIKTTMYGLCLIWKYESKFTIILRGSSKVSIVFEIIEVTYTKT